MLVIFAALILHVQPVGAVCPRLAPASLSLGLEDFDTLAGGWRSIGEHPGCEAAGARAIERYKRHNALKLVNGPPSDLAELDWHEGQLWAASGKTSRALPLLRLGKHETDPGGFNIYADAVIAFLNKDATAFHMAEEHLLALDKPDWFTRAEIDVVKNHRAPIAWPPNKEIVQNLSRCFRYSFTVAYGGECPNEVNANAKASINRDPF